MGKRVVTDTDPSQYEQHRDCCLLLSFDEYAELEDYDWIREATAEEIDAQREMLDRDDFDELAMHDSQPFLWVVVLKTAPGHIWRQASSHLRLKRFREVG